MIDKNGSSMFQLRDMFLRTDTCPVRAANDLHLCATRGRDHRMCCYKNGVTSTIAGDKCLLFCQKVIICLNKIRQKKTYKSFLHKPPYFC